MDTGQVADLLRDAIGVVLRISTPMLLLSMIVGVVVAIFQAVTQIHGLSLRLGPIGIQQHQTGEQPLLQKSEGDGRPHKPAADDGCLLNIDHKSTSN